MSDPRDSEVMCNFCKHVC